jgi:hypothetical protein
VSVETARIAARARLQAGRMTSRTYTVTLKNGRAVKITDRDLTVFRDMYIEGELATRMSELIWLDIYVYNVEFGINPYEVLDTIRMLEHGGPTGCTKTATPFNHPPLKGLWHKHFFSAHFVVQNIILGLGKDGLEKLVSEVMDPAKSSVVTREMVRELAYRAVHDPLNTRAAQERLTGEWIVYLPHRGKNYYLCCNTHGADTCPYALRQSSAVTWRCCL